MKKLSRLIVVLFSISLLVGCSLFKSKQGGAEVEEGTETSGLYDQDGFGYDGGVNYANRMKAPYNQTYHFDLNKYDVQSEDIESIHVQGNYLVTHPEARIRIEGNCDERGSREYNIALGWKRAKAAADILKQQGVDNSQIAMVSYGKEKPVAFGHDELAHSQNRRSDLVYEVK